MSESSFSAKLGVLIVAFLAAIWAFLWLLMQPVPRQELQRLGFFSALFCADAVVTLCWAAAFAYIVRKQHWPARRCDIAGLPFILVGCCVTWLFLSSGRWPIGGEFVAMGYGANLICRKLAYPQITPEEMYSPAPPLTLFPR